LISNQKSDEKWRNSEKTKKENAYQIHSRIKKKGGIDMAKLLKKKQKVTKEKTKRTNIFISYARSDRYWLSKVRTHLKVLENKNISIEVWDDTKIKAGEKWKEQIEDALSTAKIAILLITAEFIASNFINNNELPPLLKAAENDGAKIIPLIVKPSTFTRRRKLSQFQAINDPRKSLIELPAGAREKILVKLTNTIEDYFK